LCLLRSRLRRGRWGFDGLGLGFGPEDCGLGIENGLMVDENFGCREMGTAVAGRGALM